MSHKYESVRKLEFKICYYIIERQNELTERPPSSQLPEVCWFLSFFFQVVFQYFFFLDFAKLRTTLALGILFFNGFFVSFFGATRVLLQHAVLDEILGSRSVGNLIVELVLEHSLLKLIANVSIIFTRVLFSELE